MPTETTRLPAPCGLPMGMGGPQCWPECNPRMDLRTCEKLVHRVWQDYRPGVQPPEVKSGRSRLVARGGRWTIMLPPWACTKLVVLHETAHSLQRLPMGHGPEFARFLAHLWEHYAGVPSSMVLPLGLAVRPWPVRFASYTDIPIRAACVPPQPISTANATAVVATVTLGALRHSDPRRFIAAGPCGTSPLGAIGWR